MKKILLALPIGAALLLAATHIAEPEPGTCAPRAHVLDWLERTYGESPREARPAGGGLVAEVFASAATGSWTMTLTLPGDLTCLVASGTGWVEPEVQEAGFLL